MNIRTPEDVKFLAWAQVVEDLHRVRRFGVQVAGNGAIKVWPKNRRRIAGLSRQAAEDEFRDIYEKMPDFLRESESIINPEAALSRIGLAVKGG